MSENTTKNIQELGEFGLIDHLTSGFTTSNATTVLGIGDDCAVIEINAEESFLVSTDMLVEGVHFNLMYVPLKHLGYKAVAVNVSDICAMNGKAEQITVALAVSSKFPVEALEELYEGIQLACDHYQVDLVGGDMTSSWSGLSITITAIGRVANNKMTKRSGAKPNDIIVVSGDLGASYLGLQILERENEVFKSNPKVQPELEGFDALIQRQLKPEARMDIIELLEKMDVVPTSMIDISDGLASEVMHLCKQSGTGCQLFEDKIPMTDKTKLTAIEFKISTVTCALNGGEDYELLFTVRQEDFDKIVGNPSMSPIGYMTEDAAGKFLIDAAGDVVPLKAQGWQHF